MTRQGIAAAALLLPLAVPPTAAAQDARLAAAVDSLLAPALRDGSLVGMSVVVVRGRDTLLARGYGAAELAAARPATARTPFHIGSVGKHFTAAAILRLEEAGRLSVDDTVGRWLPGISRGGEVTLQHLLTHTSGYPDHTRPELARGLAQLSHPSPDDVVAAISGAPAEFAPGERYSYSNANYYLLGRVVERVTGRPLGEYMEAELFRPLGLRSTSYCGTGTAPGGARGYRGRARVPEHTWDWALGAGGVCSSAADVARWERLLAAGRVVSAPSYARMTTPATLRSGGRVPYGFGLRLDTIDGHPRVAHGGHIAGFVSQVAHYPADDLTVAVLTNSDGTAFPGEVERRIAVRLLGLADGDARPTTAEERAIYTGVYDSEPAIFRFYDRDGRLWLKTTGKGEIEMMYVGEHRWALRPAPEFRFDFQVEGSRATGFTYHEHGTLYTGVRRDGAPPGMVTAPLDTASLARFAGRYATGRDTLTLVRSGGRLAFLSSDPDPLPLLYLGGGRFAVEADPHVTLELTGDGPRATTLVYRAPGRELRATRADP